MQKIGTQTASELSNSLVMIDGRSEKQLDRIPSEGTRLERSSTSFRSIFFKYYIHDSIASCRLQLIGELTEAEVTELNGCWRTAKTILGDRKLILDLRALKSVDEAGKRWLAGMAQEGASCLPDAYLRDIVAGKHSADTEDAAPRARSGWFSRLLALLRGAPVGATK